MTGSVGPGSTSILPGITVDSGASSPKFYRSSGLMRGDTSGGRPSPSRSQGASLPIILSRNRPCWVP